MDKNVEAFLRVLDPEDTSMGGGTASAFAGAMAAALIAKVSNLSVGKAGMEDELFYQGIAAKAETLSNILFNGGIQDALAFDSVRSAYRLPKESEEEKSVRREQIQKAMTYAAEVPLVNAKNCLKCLELAGQLSGRSNPNAASDLECAKHLAHAGLMGCIANVNINLLSIQDVDVVEKYTKQVQELLAMFEAAEY